MKAETFMRVIAILMMLATFTSVALVITFAPQLKVIYNDGLYKMGASNNQNQTIIESIANVCDLYDLNESKIYCVYDIVYQTDLYSYELYDGFVYADELVERAGDCQSWTIFYMAAYEKLGFETKPITIEGHVYLTVYFEEYYCDVDQLNIACYNLNSEVNETIEI